MIKFNRKHTLKRFLFLLGTKRKLLLTKLDFERLIDEYENETNNGF